MYLSQAIITGVLVRLGKRGLVEQRRDQSDRRKVSIHPTAAGSEAVRQAPRALRERFASRLEALSPAERDEIDKVLSKVVDMMEVGELAAAPVITAGGDLDAPISRFRPNTARKQTEVATPAHSEEPRAVLKRSLGEGLKSGVMEGKRTAMERGGFPHGEPHTFLGATGP